MPTRDIVCLGASAGGLDVLSTIVGGLPADLPAAVFVVLHTGADSPGIVPTLLARAGALPAAFAQDGAPVEPGRIYVAPLDRHLALADGRTRVLSGPRQNRHRPSIDVLFRSAALAYRSRVIGVVLSGLLSDGTAGLAAIKRRGGMALVQSPSDARFPQMPESALTAVPVDHQAAAHAIAPLIDVLCREEVPPAMEDDQEEEETTLDLEARADREATKIDDLDGLGRRSVFTCPDCQGTLWEIGEDQLVRYRCHVGHAYGPGALIEYKDESLEETLWSAIRAMEENAELARRVNRRMGAHALPKLREKAAELERRADILRALLRQGTALPVAD